MFDKEFVIKKLKSLKNHRLALPLMIMLLGGVFIISFSGFGSQIQKNSEIIDDPFEYAEKLEKTLKEKICTFDSVDDCEVMVTISSISENEYLENTTTTMSSSDSQEQSNKHNEYLVINSGGEDTVVVETKKMPHVCGVLVIYEGKEGIQTENSIIDAVSTVLGIQSNKVCVISNSERK